MISKYSSHQSSLSIIENNKIISNSYKHIHLPLPAIAHDTRICFYKIVVPILNNCFHSSPMRTQKWLDIDIDTVAAPCRQRVCRRIVSSSDRSRRHWKPLKADDSFHRHQCCLPSFISAGETSMCIIRISSSITAALEKFFQ